MPVLTRICVIFSGILFSYSVKAETYHFSQTDGFLPIENTGGVFRSEKECQLGFSSISEKFKTILQTENLRFACQLDQSIKPRYRLVVETIGSRNSTRLNLYFIKLSRRLFVPTLRNQIANWIQQNELDLGVRLILEVDAGLFVMAERMPMIGSVGLKAQSIEDCLYLADKLHSLASTKINRPLLTACDFWVLGREYDFANTYPVADKKQWDRVRPAFTVERVPVKFGWASVLRMSRNDYHPFTGNRDVPIYSATVFWLNFIGQNFDQARVIEREVESPEKSEGGFSELKDCESHLSSIGNDLEFQSKERRPAPRLQDHCSFAFSKGYFKYIPVRLEF